MSAAEIFTDEYNAIVRELVAGATPLGAYAMGWVSAAAAQAGVRPDRQLLYAASRVAKLSAVEAAFEAWRKAKR